MFDAHTRVLTLPVRQHPFVGLQDHVDGDVAVGVDADAEAVGHGFVDGRVDFPL